MNIKTITMVACGIAGSLFAAPGCKSDSGATIQCDNSNEIKFALYSDLHYKKGMYIAQVGDLTSILQRAKNSGAGFAVHCGDMCNDYKGSPELIKAYLNNPFGLEVYGVYGNHELESTGNSMEVVTEKLTNRKDDVVWGTDDGKLNSEVGYYYFDKGNFRFIMLDTNYAWDGEKWVHNKTAGHGAAKGTTRANSLGYVQEQWLERILNDASAKNKGCIIISHAAILRDFWGEHETCKRVGKLLEAANAKKPGTVLLAVNGHYHRDAKCVKNNISYINCNAVRNVHWQPNAQAHYDTLTFACEKVDAAGMIVGSELKLLSDLWMSKQTWFSDKPLSAIVTVARDGHVSVAGSEAAWLHGVEPPQDGIRSTSIKNW